MFVDDQYYQPLARGTALQFGAVHQGIVGYLPTGQQVILHKSKRFGRPVASPSEELESIKPAKVTRTPRNEQDGLRIEQNAWNLIRAGAPWTLLDNCQDFVSRCYTGQSGSETRTALLAAGAFGVLLLLAFGE
jgi:hypothetical protein